MNKVLCAACVLTGWINLSLFAPATVLQAPDDEAILNQKIQIAQSKNTTSERALAVMYSFLGTPYGYSTLDRQEPEALVVNLRELDCWTSVENAVAIALTSKAEKPDFDTYKYYLQQLRYWGGTISGYGSRIHYFSGWVLQAEKQDFLTDMTRSLGGVPYQKAVTFMTDNPGLYPKAVSEAEHKKILAAQKRIGQHEWFYIPKKKFKQAESQIKEGDIIICTSRLPNLDVEHQGLAIIGKDKRLHLLHASSSLKKVVVSPSALADYLMKVPAVSGVMVARLK